MAEAIRMLPIAGLPEIRAGDDLAALIGEAAAREASGLQAADLRSASLMSPNGFRKKSRERRSAFSAWAMWAQRLPNLPRP